MNKNKSNNETCKVKESSYLSKKGYVIKKDIFTQEELIKLKSELTARPLCDTSMFNVEDTSFPLFTETKSKITIPKIYGIKKFGRPSKTTQNYTGVKWSEYHSFVGELYPEQITAVDALEKELHHSGGGIMAINTGGGKTFSALNMLSRLQMKTLIIVNKISLMKQWESEIKTVLPNIKVGIIQGQNTNIEGCDIVVSMLQSLSRIDYPESLFDDFAVTVVDEAHNTSSKMFSKVLAKTSCKYTIGLTATPQRSDGCENVFKWHLGDIVYQSHVKERAGLQPIIKNIKVKSSEYVEISTTTYSGQKQIQFTSMLSELVKMNKRNKLILELIKDLARDKRKILVLSDRRQHVIELKKMLDEENINFTYGLFLGSMKIHELNKAKACDVILATVQSFSEGVSEKDLDSLILCTPKKFIGHIKHSIKQDSGKMEQLVGRIFRKTHTEKHPLIIDIQDNFSVYKSQSNGRNVFYKEHFKNGIFETGNIDLDEYEIQNINIKCIKYKNKKEKEPENQKNLLDMNYCFIEE